MEANWDSVWLMLKFAGAMLGILALVYILACITPWLAKKIDRIRGKAPARENPADSQEEAAVKGIYDVQKKEAGEAENPFEVKGVYDFNKDKASASRTEEEK